MKFRSIEFPFFALLKCPDVINYNLTDITVQINSKDYILDTKQIEETTYFSRLVYIRSIFSNYLEFDFTTLNLSQLIRSKAKWGIDNSGKIFDLSKKEKVPFKCAKIEKVKGNLIWVKGISYPFEFKYGITEQIDKFLFAYLVKVENTWYLYDFSYKYSSNSTIRI